jgi:RNA polymerase sigma factor (sigma-70 family)
MAQGAALVDDSLSGALVEEDPELISAVREGDDRAFERLYRRYHRRIAAYVRGMVSDHARAEDVTQEVFLSALRRLRASDQTIVFKPWLYEIARNACIDQYRRSQRTPEISYEGDTAAAEHLVARGPTPEAAVDTKKQLDDLRHALRGLSTTQHDILVMREFEGLSYREIGERMSLTRPAVESALFRARRRLQEEYDALASGERCVRVQQAILAVCDGSSGARDRWCIATHVPHCAACRRHARLAGLTSDLIHASLPRRVAALLPLPSFVRRVPALRSGDRLGSLQGARGPGMAQWATTLGGAADPVVGLVTAGAAATLVLVLGGVGVGGAHSGVHHARPVARHATAPGALTRDAAATAALASPRVMPRPGTGAATKLNGTRPRGQGAGTPQAPAGTGPPTHSSHPAAGATGTAAHPSSTSPTPASPPPARHSSAGRAAQKVEHLVGSVLQKATALPGTGVPASVGSAGSRAQGAADAGQAAVDTVTDALPPAAAAVAQSVRSS